MHKICFVLFKMFTYFHSHMFWIWCEQVRVNQLGTKLFHLQFFIWNLSNIFFQNGYSLSNVTHFNLAIVQYHIFNGFHCCCCFWTSFMWIVFQAGTTTFKFSSPFFFFIENEGEASLYTLMTLNIFHLVFNFLLQRTLWPCDTKFSHFKE